MPLITLEEYKTFYNLKKPDEDDKLTMLIESVSALIQTYTGMSDMDGGQQITETISVDYDTDVIFLNNYPVDMIIEITETDRYTTDSTIHVPLVYHSDYILNSAEGILHRVYRPGGFANWPLSPGVITVTYVTGPYNGSGGFGNTVPADLKLAAIELVNYYFKEEFRQSMTIQGSSIVNTIPQGTDFPKHIQVILDRYKRDMYKR